MTVGCVTVTIDDLMIFIRIFGGMKVIITGCVIAAIKLATMTQKVGLVFFNFCF